MNKPYIRIFLSKGSFIRKFNKKPYIWFSNTIKLDKIAESKSESEYLKILYR